MIAKAVKVFCGLAVFLWLPAIATAQDTSPVQSSGIEVERLPPWPTGTWVTAEMPEGTVDAVFDQVERAFANPRSERMGETRAIVIVHKGAIVLERYGTGFDQSTKQMSWSMAKSVNQALLGAAFLDGIVADIDRPMPSAFPGDDARSQITWRQWIEMTDGLAWKEVQALNLTENDAVQMLLGDGRFDVTAYITSRQTLRPPGRHWNYNTGSTILVAEALARQLTRSSDPADVKARYDELLFRPLGMDVIVEFDAAGTPLAGGLMWAAPRDWAKLGLLYLRDGVWDGERLLPEGWVDWARTGSETDDGNVYGAGFWRMVPVNQATHAGRSPDDGPWDAYAMQGSEGQVVWIVPSRDLLIVRTGIMTNERDNWVALMNWCQAIARAFPEVTVR